MVRASFKLGRARVAAQRLRDEYGREPRVRSPWEQGRELTHGCARQRKAAWDGKLTPIQEALLEGEIGFPTGEIVWIEPTFAGNYEACFWQFGVPTMGSRQTPLGCAGFGKFLFGGGFAFALHFKRPR